MSMDTVSGFYILGNRCREKLLMCFEEEWITLYFLYIKYTLVCGAARPEALVVKISTVEKYLYFI